MIKNKSPKKKDLGIKSVLDEQPIPSVHEQLKKYEEELDQREKFMVTGKEKIQTRYRDIVHRLEAASNQEKLEWNVFWSNQQDKLAR